MSQKYPNAEVPYRYRRKVADCCYTHRNGWSKPKRRYASLEEVQAEALRIKNMRVCKCRNVEGTYHLRSKKQPAQI